MSPEARIWRLRGSSLACDRPLLLGVLNVTPDSFSDGGQYGSVDRAIARAGEMLAEGVDVIDVGGESTRPQSATPVSADEERARVVPVIRAILAEHPAALISVDTVKANVAAAALDAGAHAINDVSGFRLDDAMANVCATTGAGVVLMHSRGSVSTMGTYERATYGADPVGEMVAELALSQRRALDGGVRPDALVLDPGLGFAKRSEHSLAALAALERFVALGAPVLVGASRKRFIGEITGVAEPAARISGTVGAHVAALSRGARLFRVHDVRAHREALDVAWRALALDRPSA
jgi:dihydropteroate synthase